METASRVALIFWGADQIVTNTMPAQDETETEAIPPFTGAAAGMDDDEDDSVSFADWKGDKTTSNKGEKEAFTEQETIVVNRFKVLVYVALLFAAAGVGLTTYKILSREQANVFEVEVRYVAVKSSCRHGTLLTDILRSCINFSTLTQHALFILLL